MRALHSAVALLLALVALAAASDYGRIAWAEHLRSGGDTARIRRAVLLDDQNAYGHTLEAELYERSGATREAEGAWREAVRRNPNDAEAWIRIAALAERRGDDRRAQAYLLQAAAVSQTWIPRWAMVNFCVRHQRPQETLQWARLALQRASGDVGALFPILDDTAQDWTSILPPNRCVLAACINDRFIRDRPALLRPIAERLAAAIPNTVPEWPGLDRRRWWDGSEWPATDWERSRLLGAVDRLLAAGMTDEATSLWNTLNERGIAINGRWTTAAPLVNPRVREPQNGGLDWLLKPSDGVLFYKTEPFTVELTGNQRAALEIVEQRLVVPAGHAYRLYIESRSDGLDQENGLRWEIRDIAGKVEASVPVAPSMDWRTSSAELSGGTATRRLTIALYCQRLPSGLRPQGQVSFRSVRLEQSP